MNAQDLQRRGRRIAMTSHELDAYLTQARTCRVATIGADGSPHLSALWFVWDGKAIWLNSIVRSQRWTNLMRDPRASVLVDAGHDFGDLHGVELAGRVEVVGEVPRTGTAHPRLIDPEQIFGEKYADGNFSHDGAHAWVTMVPTRIVSWDFRKMTG